MAFLFFTITAQVIWTVGARNWCVSVLLVDRPFNPGFFKPSRVRSSAFPRFLSTDPVTDVSVNKDPEMIKNSTFVLVEEFHALFSAVKTLWRRRTLVHTCSGQNMSYECEPHVVSIKPHSSHHDVVRGARRRLFPRVPSSTTVV
jgi:hypothetical protein